MNDEMRRGIGDNLPPAVTDEEFQKLEERKAALLLAVDDALSGYVSTDKDHARMLIELAKMCGVFCSTVEDKRRIVKAPILEAGKQCDGKFQDLTTDLVFRIAKLKESIRLFMDWASSDQLRTEHGALASVRRDMRVEKVDRKKVDLNMLKEFIPTEVIENAALAYCRSKERYQLKGVKFKERSTILIK